MARFNPAPGWPTPPPGWEPPPGWRPDPDWPPEPPGWRFWIEDDEEPAGPEPVSDTLLLDAAFEPPNPAPPAEPAPTPRKPYRALSRELRIALSVAPVVALLVLLGSMVVAAASSVTPVAQQEKLAPIPGPTTYADDSLWTDEPAVPAATPTPTPAPVYTPTPPPYTPPAVTTPAPVTPTPTPTPARTTPTPPRSPAPTPTPTPSPSATPTTTPTPTPGQAAVHEGRGDKVVQIQLTGPSLLALTHDGSQNFTVHTLNASGGKQDLLVSATGSYSGTRPVKATGPALPGSLNIRADGAWKITVKPLDSARTFTGTSLTGRGDDVVRISPATTTQVTLAVAHTGTREFVLSGGAEQSVLLTATGNHTGDVTVPAGTEYLTVRADGDWTLTRR
ncbi:hypothetical protein [Rhizohabitans arisaemae]|uniref:hypothetical protein n=1 Tax=Rhizohabitans arisaemae TaxID=2720610 RepID=UPI0024B1CB8C|nr:hypothetical protein [Rhizohabitans arisaemae]